MEDVYTEKEQVELMLAILVETYQEIEPGCGLLHVIIEDLNVEDRFITSALNDCIKAEDYWGQQICNLLQKLTEEERYKVLDETWQYKAKLYELDKRFAHISRIYPNIL